LAAKNSTGTATFNGKANIQDITNPLNLSLWTATPTGSVVDEQDADWVPKWHCPLTRSGYDP
jgi:hypothetical protein